MARQTDSIFHRSKPAVIRETIMGLLRAADGPVALTDIAANSLFRGVHFSRILRQSERLVGSGRLVEGFDPHNGITLEVGQ